MLYDIHGNLPALDAVLADARTAGAEQFVLGGDYALFGAYPAETAARLAELDAVWIRGNTDRWLEDAPDAPSNVLVRRSLEHCRQALDAEDVHRLATLAPTAALDGALVCHASPRSDMQTFMPNPSEADSSLLDEHDPDVILFGHGHLQFRRRAGRHTLVNPGSVGLPFDGDQRAAYALWPEGAPCELRRVAYDSDAYADAVLDRMSATLGDAVETLVHRVRQAAS